MKMAERGAEDRQRAVDPPGPGAPSAATARCSMRSPVGIGMPSATPIGTQHRDGDQHPRAPRETESPSRRSASATTMNASATTATVSDADRAAAPRAVAPSNRRLHAAPSAGAEQQREQRDGQRVDRMAEQQHEPLQHRHLDQHEAGAERAEVHQPREPSARARWPRPANDQRSDDEQHDKRRSEMPSSVMQRARARCRTASFGRTRRRTDSRASWCGRRTGGRRSSAGCPGGRSRRTARGRGA